MEAGDHVATIRRLASSKAPSAPRSPHGVGKVVLCGVAVVVALRSGYMRHPPAGRGSPIDNLSPDIAWTMKMRCGV
jgi:hypothetical protein